MGFVQDAARDTSSFSQMHEIEHNENHEWDFNSRGCSRVLISPFNFLRIRARGEHSDSLCYTNLIYRAVVSINSSMRFGQQKLLEIPCLTHRFISVNIALHRISFDMKMRLGEAIRYAPPNQEKYHPQMPPIIFGERRRMLVAWTPVLYVAFQLPSISAGGVEFCCQEDGVKRLLMCVARKHDRKCPLSPSHRFQRT